MIECELRRLRCAACGVRLEPVPWARPGAAHTRDLKDVVAWLVQQMATTPITGLLRVGWDMAEALAAPLAYLRDQGGPTPEPHTDAGRVAA